MVTMRVRDRGNGVTEPGRRPYTDEQTIKASAVFLAEPEQQWREDAARYRLTLGAVHVELSRLYADEETRKVVLRRALERAGLPIPPDLS